MADFIKPDWRAPASIGALSTLRSGGVSVGAYGAFAAPSGQGGWNFGRNVGDDPVAVQENRARLAALLPAAPVWLSQVHGTNVVDAAQVSGSVDADASFTTARGVVCLVQTADCLPVLFCDVDGRVVAAAHAGWRGLLNGVLEQTVAAMRGAGAGEILAWLGPAIGPLQFEVGAEVRQAFLERAAQDRAETDAAFLPVAGSPGKYLADIYMLARLRLALCGAVRCHGGHFCTVTDVASFYSYRRDKTTGRMASMVWID